MAYRRTGFGDTTGYTPAQQAMADAFASEFGGGGAPAVYVAPVSVAVPTCSQDTQPGGAAFSDACISQVLATQQQNLQLANNANYQVDLQNCLNTYPQPTDCYQRTFGLTPTGGYTSDAQTQGAPIILDSSGNPVSGIPVATQMLPAPAPYVAPTPAPASAPVSQVVSQPLPSPAAATNYVAQGTDFLTGDTTVAGFTFPTWGLLAAGAAALYFLTGKH